MSKVPEKPEEVFEEFTAKVAGVFGDNLLSINLYGSGARGEYIREKSDLNFLIIIKSEGLSKLGGLWEYLVSWRKQAISTPLVLTESYVQSSLDSFPLEFLDMKDSHVTVFGEDPFDDIKIGLPHLRLQVERELKSKLLALRQGYLETRGKERELYSLLSILLNSSADMCQN